MAILICIHICPNKTLIHTRKEKRKKNTFEAQKSKKMVKDLSPQANENSSKTRQDFCSTFMKKERVRYQRKGFGLFVAFVIAISFFTLVPYFGK